MQSVQQNQDDFSNLSESQLLEIPADERNKNIQNESRLSDQSKCLKTVEKKVDAQQECFCQQGNRIRMLQELLRLCRLQKFAANSEKLPFQASLFFEAELESAIEDLMDQETDEAGKQADTEKSVKKKPRQFVFSVSLKRVRIELTLFGKQRSGAERTLFTRAKAELEYVLAVMEVLEYWQQKAVFSEDDSENIVATGHSIHPLGKCSVTTSLLTQTMTAKYVMVCRSIVRRVY